MHREDGPVHGVDVLELFTHETQRQVIETVAAVTLGEANSGQPQRRKLGKDLRVVMPGAVVGGDPGRELPGAEIADGGNQLLLVRSEG